MTESVDEAAAKAAILALDLGVHLHFEWHGFHFRAFPNGNCDYKLIEKSPDTDYPSEIRHVQCRDLVAAGLISAAFGEPATIDPPAPLELDMETFRDLYSES